MQYFRDTGRILLVDTYRYAPRGASTSSFMQLVILFSLAFIAFAVNAEPVDALLNKMTHAMKVNNYEGTLVIRQADKLQAMQIKHGVDDSGVWESLESLSGEQRQVIRKNGKVTTVFPERHLVTISHDKKSSPFHPQLPKNRELLKQFYNVTLAGQGRVANKDAQILRVMPKDKYRYGYKFWLEKDTGLLLKCDLMDERGKIVEQLMFSELIILPESPETNLLLEKAKQYRVVDLDQGREIQKKTHWQAKYLPKGFMLTRSNIKPGKQGKGLVQHIIYSDGMASVSVFVEQNKPEEMILKGFSKAGVINAYGVPTKNHHVTVIGEVPAATVRLIGESVVQVVSR
jgi:sigma-E factor negative regulatory protein RseB